MLVKSDLSEKLRDKLPKTVQLVNIPYRHIHSYTAIGLGKVVDKLMADLFFSPHMLQPIMMKTPGVITLHDTMWFDKTWTQAQGKPLRMLAGKAYFRSLVELSVRKTRKVIVPSQSTYRDFAQFWPHRITNCHVIYHGIDPLFHRQATEALDIQRVNHLGLSGTNFFLHISNGKPYKNTPRVIEAFIKVAATSDARLAIVGRKSAFTSSIQSLISSSSVNERIKFLGSVDDEDLAALFRTSIALVFPSLFEGFGLPVIEAMACGCPVITSSRGSLEEITGDAGLIVDPEETDDIANAMIRMSTEPGLRQSFIQLGRKRARQFSWDKSAQEILNVFRQALGYS